MWRNSISKISKKNYDHIIVGAGSAGCVLANRLTECGSKNVLLVEAGPPDTFFGSAMAKWQIHMPSGLLSVNYRGSSQKNRKSVTFKCGSL